MDQGQDRVGDGGDGEKPFIIDYEYGVVNCTLAAIM